MDDSSKAEVMVDKKDTKEAAPEVKSGEKEETDTKEEKIEEKSEDDEDGDDDEGEDEDEDEEKETLPRKYLMIRHYKRTQALTFLVLKPKKIKTYLTENFKLEMESYNQRRALCFVASLKLLLFSLSFL